MNQINKRIPEDCSHFFNRCYKSQKNIFCTTSTSKIRDHRTFSCYFSVFCGSYSLYERVTKIFKKKL